MAISAKRRALYRKFEWARRKNDAYALMLYPDGVCPSREASDLVRKHWVMLTDPLIAELDQLLEDE